MGLQNCLPDKVTNFGSTFIKCQVLIWDCDCQNWNWQFGTHYSPIKRVLLPTSLLAAEFVLNGIKDVNELSDLENEQLIC